MRVVRDAIALFENERLLFFRSLNRAIYSFALPLLIFDHHHRALFENELVLFFRYLERAIR